MIIALGFVCSVFSFVLCCLQLVRILRMRRISHENV